MGAGYLNGRTLCAAALLLAAETCFPQTAPFWFLDQREEGIATWDTGVATEDGGYLLLGSSWETVKSTRNTPFPLNHLVVQLVRLSEDGSLEWKRSYGTPPSSSGLALSPSSDGGFCVLAAAYARIVSLEGDGRLWVFKVGSGGDRIWEALLEGDYRSGLTLMRPQPFFSVAGTRDGGCVVAGGTATERTGRIQVRVVSIDARGRILWDRAYGTGPAAVAHSIAATETGLIVAGLTSGLDAAPSALLLRLDAKGNLLRENRYGDPKTKVFSYHVLPLPDGGALLSGAKSTLDGQRGAWSARLDRDGKVLWDRTFKGGSLSFIIRARQSAGDRFELLGVSGNVKPGSPHRALVLRVDASGKNAQSRILRQPIGQLEGILPTADGGYLLLGADVRGPPLVKVDRGGGPEIDPLKRRR